jgi:hypothetical protein
MHGLFVNPLTRSATSMSIASEVEMAHDEVYRTAISDDRSLTPSIGILWTHV